MTADKLKAAFERARASGAGTSSWPRFASALGTDSAHVTAAMDAARSDRHR